MHLGVCDFVILTFPKRDRILGMAAAALRLTLESVMDLEAGLIHPVSDEHLPQAVPV